MSKALLTHGYFYKLDRKQWQFKQPYPPLMTIQAAAVVRQAGLDVSFFDSNLKSGPHEIVPILNEVQPKYCILVDDGFNYLTKMCLSVMRQAAFSIIKNAKEKNCLVIVNSSDASDHVGQYLNAGADYVIRGEVEDSLEELVAMLEAGNDATVCAGISFLSNGMVTSNPARPVLRDLDKLPMPAWDLIDVSAYQLIWKKHHGYFSLNMATTRGCPYKCNWCAKPIYGNRYNSRSPEHVVNELEILIKEYGMEHVWMSDDIFGLKPGWVESFSLLTKQRNLNFKYKIQSRVDLLLNENSIEALRSSGIETVWVGAESGSQKILDAMDKGITVEQIRHATNLLKASQIRVGHFLQFGYPGETAQDIQATLDLVLELMPDEIGISISYPLPGTKFFENVKDMLHNKQNWVDSDDLDMLFVGTYTPRYYKILHRYIHNRYRIQRGINQLKQSFSWSRQSLRNIISMFYNIPWALINRFQLSRILPERSN